MLSWCAQTSLSGVTRLAGGFQPVVGGVVGGRVVVVVVGGLVVVVVVGGRVVVVGGRVVVVAVDGGALPVQTVPLTVKLVGTGLVPLQEPRKPRDSVVPVGTAAFQLALVAVTVAPACDQDAFHPCVTRCAVVGNVKETLHPLSGSPRLLTVRAAWNPSDQAFVTA